MATFTLTFTLPDEQEEVDCCMAAPQFERAIRDLSEAFRRHRKYDAPPVNEETFWDILKDNEIDRFF